MIGLLLGTVWAGTLSVPGDFADIGDALANALPGDVIEVGPGTWTGPFALFQDITLTSTDGAETTILQAFGIEATVTVGDAFPIVEGFTIRCSPTAAVGVVNGSLTLTDSVISGCPNSSAVTAESITGTTSLTLRDTTLSGLSGTAAGISTIDTLLTLQRVLIEDPGNSGSAPVLDSDGGAWILEDLTVRDVQRTGPILLGVGLGSVAADRTKLSCLDGGTSVLSIDAFSAQIGPLMSWKNTVEPGGAVLSIDAANWSVDFATFVGGPDQVQIQANSGVGTVQNTAFGGDGTTVFGAGGLVTGRYNLFDDGVSVAAGTAVEADIAGEGTVNAPPAFEAFDPDGPCIGDILVPALGSPLIDAADPVLVDRDGSRADIGATGGAQGFDLLGEDRDLDGTPDAQDCEPLDPTIHPNAQEIPYDDIDQDCDGSDLRDVDQDGYEAEQVGGDDCDDGNSKVHPGAVEDLSATDLDCDGYTDPTGALSPRTCGTTGKSGGIPVFWAWILLAGTLIRRSQPQLLGER